jgi:hypothetical protein
MQGNIDPNLMRDSAPRDAGRWSRWWLLLQLLWAISKRIILRKLREPSTWAGFAALFMAAGFSDDVGQQIVAFGAAVAGAMAVLLDERR